MAIFFKLYIRTAKGVALKVSGHVVGDVELNQKTPRASKNVKVQHMRNLGNA